MTICNRAFSSFFRKVAGLVLLVIPPAGCGDNGDSQRTTHPPPAPVPVHSVLFFDKSVSMNVATDFIRRKYEGALAGLIEQNIRTEGDRLSVYFIHENTSKARALQVTATARLEDVSSLNDTDAEAVRTEFEVTLQKERQRFLEQARNQLGLVNTGTSNQTTDLWATLAVLSKVAKPGETTKAYYFSDMVESVPGPGRRDFGRLPPAGADQAEAWAGQDAERLRKRLDSARLRNVQIRMVLPFEPTSSSKLNNPSVTHYWETLFVRLGITTPAEEL
ncbi:MAG: hypothetical protein H7Z75_05745 [Ferruginibacter sp.]|nr:hypothetical protein [Cytophagales bacterium]